MLIAKADTKNAIDIFRRALIKSEPVIFSTDTIYGIGAPLSDIAANEKIFNIKGRDRSKPFPVLISSLIQLEEIAVIETDIQKDIIDIAWPGAVTLILKAKDEVNHLFTLNGTLAVRMPDKKWLKELVDNTGAISATSANPAGYEYVNYEKTILNTFKNSVEFFLFDSNSKNISSSIIDVSHTKPILIRKGENTSIMKKIVKYL